MKFLTPAAALNIFFGRRNLTQQQTIAELMTAIGAVQSKTAIELMLLAAGIKNEDMPERVQRPSSFTLNTTRGKWEVISYRALTAGGTIYLDVATNDVETLAQLEEALQSVKSLGANYFGPNSSSYPGSLPNGFHCELAIGATAEAAMKQWHGNVAA